LRGDYKREWGSVLGSCAVDCCVLCFGLRLFCGDEGVEGWVEGWGVLLGEGGGGEIGRVEAGDIHGICGGTIYGRAVLEERAPTLLQMCSLWMRQTAWRRDRYCGNSTCPGFCDMSVPFLTAVCDCIIGKWHEFKMADGKPLVSRVCAAKTISPHRSVKRSERAGE
jgi:hypothetical protein